MTTVIECHLRGSVLLTLSLAALVLGKARSGIKARAGLGPSEASGLLASVFTRLPWPHVFVPHLILEIHQSYWIGASLGVFILT